MLLQGKHMLQGRGSGSDAGQAAAAGPGARGGLCWAAAVGLKTDELPCCQVLSSPCFEHAAHAWPACLRALAFPAAGLTRLTSLCLDQAYDFGSRALLALAPLASLRRLSLSGISLTRASLLSALSEEEGPPSLLPGLTYLALTNCQLLRWAAGAAGVCIAAKLGATAREQPQVRDGGGRPADSFSAG